MNISKKFRKRILAIGAIVAFWSLFALLYTFSSFLMYGQESSGFRLTLHESLLFELVCISPWAVSTPFIIKLAGKYPVGRSWNWQNMMVHLGAALCVFTFHSFVQSYAVSVFFENMELSWSYIRADFLGFADMRILLYIGLLLGVYTYEFYRKNRETKLREPRLRAELDRLNFQKILNQIQPEFLINSIDTVKQTIGISHREAEKSLIEISTLLRMMLKNIRKEELTVQEDLEYLSIYLDMKERKLGKKIERTDDIEPACYHALIPNFLFIMPLLEELLKVESPKIEPFRSFINRGWVEEGRLHLLAIIDEFDLDAEDLDRLKENVGMQEIESRLKQRYNSKLSLDTTLEGRSIHIHLILPYKKAPEESFNPYNGRIKNAAKQ